MRPSESGRITFKAILSLAFIVAVIFAAFKIIPVYVNDYELNDYIGNQTPFWLTQRATAEAIGKNVLAKAQDLGLPLAAENVTVNANPNKVTVSVDYHVPVDLKLFTLPLHFSHSNGNSAIQ
ncbi:MAG TPA: hypothetical protein VMO17_13105 [Terriglobia bacterium]|nr:hypothetical protein [Terriglobia bacterium]